MVNMVVSTFHHDVIVIILLIFDTLLICILYCFLVLMIVKSANEKKKTQRGKGLQFESTIFLEFSYKHKITQSLINHSNF